METEKKLPTIEGLLQCSINDLIELSIKSRHEVEINAIINNLKKAHLMAISETVKCECGNNEDVTKAIIDEDGTWWCQKCYEEQKSDRGVFDED